MTSYYTEATNRSLSSTWNVSASSSTSIESDLASTSLNLSKIEHNTSAKILPWTVIDPHNVN